MDCFAISVKFNTNSNKSPDLNLRVVFFVASSKLQKAKKNKKKKLATAVQQAVFLPKTVLNKFQKRVQTKQRN